MRDIGFASCVRTRALDWSTGGPYWFEKFALDRDASSFPKTGQSRTAGSGRHETVAVVSKRLTEIVWIAQRISEPAQLSAR